MQQTNATGPATFTREQIIEAMNTWREKIVSDVDFIINCFGEKTTFSYYRKDLTEEVKQVHMYAGLVGDEIYFFAIPDIYDNEAYKDSFERYVEPCKLGLLLGNGNEIDSKEARARMAAWTDNYKEWLPQQSRTEDGIFQIFTIDKIDFVDETDGVHMALQPTLGTPTGFTADLIITAGTQAAPLYEDFSKPIPPFGATAQITDFYLFTL